MGPPWRIDPTTYRTMSKCSYRRASSRFTDQEVDLSHQARNQQCTLSLVIAGVSYMYSTSNTTGRTHLTQHRHVVHIHTIFHSIYFSLHLSCLHHYIFSTSVLKVCFWFTCFVSSVHTQKFSPDNSRKHTTMFLVLHKDFPVQKYKTGLCSCIKF